MPLSSLPNNLSFVRQNDFVQNLHPTSQEEPRRKQEESLQGRLSTQNDVPERRRVRRDTPQAEIPDSEVADRFSKKIDKAKAGAGADAYLRGYNSPESVPLPAGYSDSMSDVQFYRLALQPGVTN